MMPTTNLLLSASLLMTGIGHSYSQGPPQTPEQVLIKAGVSLDPQSLIQALYDKRDGVEASSATVLAEKHSTEAIPAIASQMKLARNAQLVLTLAQSLNTLGSLEGAKQLEAFCLAKDTEGGERMRAAYALAGTGDYRCIPAVAKQLSSSYADEKQAALLYLAQIPSFQESEPRSLGPRLLAIATSDHDEASRDLARKVIEQIGDPDTKNALLRQEKKEQN